MPTKKANNNTITRYRNFACVVYPESAPDKWQNIIAEAKTPVFISPLHDKDVNPTGEPKKPHFHVLVCYEGKKSFEQAETFFKSFGGVGCEVVQSIRGYARYLCHLDNPEKAQYQTEQVKSFGGADYNSTIGLAIDKYKAIREIINFCNLNDVDSYAELLEYASLERFDWFRILCDNGTVVIKEFLKSKQWEREHHYTHKLMTVDSDGVVEEPPQNLGGSDDTTSSVNDRVAYGGNNAASNEVNNADFHECDLLGTSP